MKIKTIIFLVFFCGLTLSVLADQAVREILISGLRLSTDPLHVDPDPQSSPYLLTRVAGFKVSEYGARYFCVWDIIKERDKTIYVRIELENAFNKSKPIIQDGIIGMNAQSLNVVFGPIPGIKMHQMYQVKVTLYNDEARIQEIDQLTQDIKSYVDTQDKDVKVDQSLTTNTGENIGVVLKNLNKPEPPPIIK
ncbi:MAG: hypothetical protein H6754_03480 [Candidatus Omnitrophica bacterium]|nr:hypothetical protein [Candidatus Omnitrophota bacterium]